MSKPISVGVAGENLSVWLFVANYSYLQDKGIAWSYTDIDA